MPKIIVLGAGVCGLAAGMLLAGDGHQVTIVERDSTSPPDTPQQARDRRARTSADGPRQATPQPPLKIGPYSCQTR